jgi:hypothetical protein
MGSPATKGRETKKRAGAERKRKRVEHNKRERQRIEATNTAKSDSNSSDSREGEICPFSSPSHKLTLAVNVSIRRNDADLTGVDLNDLELDGVHGLSHKEHVALLDGPVSLAKVGLKVNLKEVAGHTLDGVVDGEDVDALSVRDILGLVDGNDITKANPEVLADALVHPHGVGVYRVVTQHYADSLLTTLTLDGDGTTVEELELGHPSAVDLDDAVIIVGRLVDNQAVRGALNYFGASRGSCTSTCGGGGTSTSAARKRTNR